VFIYFRCSGISHFKCAATSCQNSTRLNRSNTVCRTFKMAVLRANAIASLRRGVGAAGASTFGGWARVGVLPRRGKAMAATAPAVDYRLESHTEGKW
jgi:hypothetical protein